MLILFGAAGLHPEWPAAVLCLGTFDGFHIGHQAVIRTAVDIARANGLPCGLVTFDRHPALTLAPERAPMALSLPTDNLDLLETLGVDMTVVLEFDRALSETSAEDFLDRVLRSELRASHLVVGHDFAFGHDRQGTTEWLRQRIPTTVVPPFELNGIRVSSSAIRNAIQAGELDSAARMLGRPISLRGIVVGGDRLGRELGFPTANIALPARHILPPDGVYVAQAVTPFGQFAAAVSIGNRPTVGGTTRVIEAYLLDYPGTTLYGRTLSIELSQKVRDQRKFASTEELTEWIRTDIEAVRAAVLN